MVLQLPLHLSLREDATFDNYYFSRPNAPLGAALKNMTHHDGFNFMYLWGGLGVGRTHLLQATCLSAQTEGATAVYLPLADKSLALQILQGLEHLAYVCLDDIESVAGNPEWEEAIFHLFNRLKEEQATMVVAAELPPQQLGIQLADLASRLTWGLTYQIKPLSDEDKTMVLIQGAKKRGMDLPRGVAKFILTHYRRDLAHLLALLERLDRESLARQRKLTIPFVKSVIVNRRESEVV